MLTWEAVSRKLQCGDVNGKWRFEIHVGNRRFRKNANPYAIKLYDLWAQDGSALYEFPTIRAAKQFAQEIVKC